MYYANSMDMLVDGEVQTVPILDTTKAPAIIETTSGETVSIQDSAVAPFSGLKLFGKATQDGAPSPESPVPIDIAGSGGTVNISITGGTAETQTLQLSTPNGLPGLKVSSGGNYTDATGQQWICDVIDLDAGTYTQNCKISTFDGSTDEGWSYGQSWSQISAFFADAKNFSFPSGTILSDRFKSGSTSDRNSGIRDIVYQGSGSRGFLGISSNIFTSLQTALSWLRQNPITIIYVLDAPVVTQLSSEEIAAYKALLSNYPSTSIFSDSTPQVGIEASYTADTKTYIDNKISQAVAIAKA